MAEGFEMVNVLSWFAFPLQPGGRRDEGMRDGHEFCDRMEMIQMNESWL